MMNKRRSFVDALHRGVFGSLDRVEACPLHQAQQPVEALAPGRLAAAKLVLLP